MTKTEVSKTVKVTIVEKTFRYIRAKPLCLNAYRFTCIAGTDYLTGYHLTHIQKLGFEIVIVNK